MVTFFCIFSLVHHHCLDVVQVAGALISHQCDVGEQHPIPSNGTLSSLIESMCTLFFAPSTIPGAGLGIFATVSKNQFEIIGHGDVLIPLLEMAWHNARPRIQRTHEPSFMIFDSYGEYM
jgi:hypothetical protein